MAANIIRPDVERFVAEVADFPKAVISAGDGGTHRVVFTNPRFRALGLCVITDLCGLRHGWAFRAFTRL